MVSKVEEVIVKYEERVKHAYSNYRTNDEELAWAETISSPAERIDVITSVDDDGPHETEVVVMTNEGVYHFSTFRSYYIGHSSRTLIQLLNHFKVVLPLDFVIEMQTFTVYLDGHRVVDSENKEYALAVREGDVLYLVEPVNWDVKSETIDTIQNWCNQYGISPEEVVELSVSLLKESGMGENVVNSEELHALEKVAATTEVETN